MVLLTCLHLARAEAPPAAEGTPASGEPPAAEGPEAEGSPEGDASPAVPNAPAPESPGAASSLEPTPSQAEHDQLTREEDAREAYVKALAAWKRRSWKAAWVEATRALALDPELSEARLLAGYAALRLGKRGEGAETLAGLWLEPGPTPLPAASLEEARIVRSRYVAPLQRDQWWIGLGPSFFLEHTGGDTTPLLGWSLAAQAPVIGGLAVRLQGGGPWLGPEDDFDIRGPRFDLLAVGAAPLGGGLWHVDLAAGPSLWLATGGFWYDGSQPFVGARAAVGLDTRFGAGFGMRWEVGGSAYPQAAEDFSFYAEAVDVRVLFQGWFGAVPGEPRRRVRK